ncbi:MAG: class I SAM-dependent methyltransferase [Spirochaetes bacterium]|jgi:uncharacterized protein YbaR (Trm112 family)|nr:class I SAM-dependent methyltransferase [Spirochaetota bacterium]
MKKDLLDILACPSCKKKIVLKENFFRCGSCKKNFEMINGVPVLMTEIKKKKYGGMMNSDESKKMMSEYYGKEDFLDRMSKKIPLPFPMYNARPQFKKSIWNKLYESRKERTLVLSIGGGPSRDDHREINLNIGLFPNVDIVADGYEVPIRSGSVDSVICKAVLEHVEFPDKLIREMRRVLKKGGHLYVEAPFLFVYHSYPSDFFRYTVTGLEALCSDFSKIESGIVLGPTSSVLEIFITYILLLVPNIKFLKKMTSAFFRIILSPFKYLDLLLNKKEGAHSLSAGLYFFGAK